MPSFDYANFLQKHSHETDPTAHSGTYVAWLDVKKYGAVGNGTTDDTAAIQDAIDAAAAGSSRIVYFPAGRYKVTSTLAITTKGIRFVGERQGRQTTYGGSQIEASFNNDVLIELGTDDSEAHDAGNYDGAAEGFSAENIGFKATGTLTALDNGQGVGYCAGTTAIKDWRGGSIRLKDVWFEHFDYPFWGIQSDFNAWDGVDMWYCHSGAYIGPRSDQFTIQRLLGKLCDRVLDIDGPQHVRIYDLQCVDSGAASTNPVRIRSDWSHGPSGGILFDKPWFEQLAAGVNIEAFVEVGIGATNQQKDIVFESPRILTNDSGTTPHSSFFLKTDNADRIVINDPQGDNISNLTQLIRNVGTVSPGVVIRHGRSQNLRAQNDSTGTLDPATQRWLAGVNQFQRQENGAPALRVGKVGESVSRWSFLSTGLIQASDGTNAADLDISRDAANVLAVGSGDAIRTGTGATGSRPSASAMGTGAQWFDSTLNRPIWSNGSAWVDALGNPVDNDFLLADLITTGEETIPRDRVASTGLTMTSQVLRLCYFTARKTETITQVVVDTGGTAAGATPSLVRIGVWTADSAGALLSQVATTPNDTALLAGTFTSYTKSFSSSFSKTAGQRYAVGLLVVTAAAAPAVLGGLTALNNGHVNRAPRISAQVTGQADLPATVASGSLSNSNNRPYFVLLP